MKEIIATKIETERGTMELRNKKTGEVVKFSGFGITVIGEDGKTRDEIYNSLSELEKEWEDMPEEPTGVKTIYGTGNTVFIEMHNKKEAVEAKKKLNAWRRLNDKGFRVNKWAISEEPKTPHIKLVIEAEMDVPDSPYGLDLLFGWDSTKPKIISKLAKVEIAPEDYHEGDKTYFTWEEAMEAAKKLGDGWRLPTKDEWVLIDKEFADSDSKKIQKKLRLTLDGCYWSSTAYTYTTVYGYSLDNLYTNPKHHNAKYVNYSVRLVRDLEEK